MNQKKSISTAPSKVVAGLKKVKDAPALELPIPNQDRVLITRKEPEKVTAGGIIIPETSIEDDVNQGYVVAVGPLVGKYFMTNETGIPSQLKVGSRVDFGDYAGKEVVVNGKKYLVMRESDILLIYP